MVADCIVPTEGCPEPPPPTEPPASVAPILSGVGYNNYDLESTPGSFGLQQCPSIAPYAVTRGIARWRAPSGSILYFDPGEPWLFESFFYGYEKPPGLLDWHWSIYRSGEASPEEEDPKTGYVYRHPAGGRFLAVCTVVAARPGFKAGVVAARELYDPPVLVRRRTSGTTSCSSTAPRVPVVYDPSAPPENCSGTGVPGSGGTLSCHVEELRLEISYDGGRSWQFLYWGSVTVCK